MLSFNYCLNMLTLRRLIRLMMMYVLSAIVLTATVFGSSGGNALMTPAEHQWLKENQSRLVLAVETDYPPFVFLDPNKQPSGLAHDYLLLLQSKLSAQFNQKQFSSLESIFAEVRTGEVQIVNAVTKTPERSEFLLFTEPIISVPNVILVREDQTRQMVEKDLAGLKVSLVKSYAITEHLSKLQPDLKIDLVDDDLSALLSVSFGHSDAAVVDLATASYLINSKGITNLRVAGEATSGVQLSIAVPHSETILHSILQKGLNAITEAERHKIHQRWINASSQSIFRDRRFWIAASVVLVAIFGVLAAIILWNRTLQQQLALRTEELGKEKDELLESRSLLNRIIDGTTDAVFMKDLLGRYLLFNSAAQRVVGKTAAEVFGKDDLAIFQPAEAIVVMEGDRKVIEDGIVKTYEEVVTDAAGRYLTFLSTKGPVYDSKGNAIGLFGIARDITERIQAEEARAKLEAQLHQSQKVESVGRLAGGVAHDFNNMLSVILGHTEIALMRMDQNQPLYSSLLEIRKAAERSADLTRQLLAFARKQTVAPKVINLNETVAGMLSMLQRLIGENIQLTWKPAQNLWPVMMDCSQVDQIMANLCVNARDAIVDIGRISIETGNCSIDEHYSGVHSYASPGEYVKITVSDDGHGMDAETLEHIFEPFFTTKEVGAGTGLGLATVYGIVRQNNGFINAYSEPGTGTTFTIYLPRYQGETEEAQQEGAAEPSRRGHETILLVEDEEAILEITAMILTELGYCLLKANSPGEALQRAYDYSGEIDLLITDVIMPEMNGRDLANNLCSYYPQLKSLFMSGYTADIISHQGVLDEGVQFIQKPFRMNELAAKVREVLDKPNQ